MNEIKFYCVEAPVNYELKVDMDRTANIKFAWWNGFMEILKQLRIIKLQNSRACCFECVKWKLHENIQSFKNSITSYNSKNTYERRNSIYFVPLLLHFVINTLHFDFTFTHFSNKDSRMNVLRKREKSNLIYDTFPLQHAMVH